jgi:hypothetical protein
MKIHIVSKISIYFLISCVVILLSERRGLFAADSFQKPLMDEWIITQDFGNWNSSFGSGGYHLAEDLRADQGTSVFATSSGIVKYAATNAGSYGAVVIIEHQLSDGTNICSLYGHLSTYYGLEVSTGQQVLKGQEIGKIAMDYEDGGTWGPHLHFGFRYGSYSTETICGYWPYIGYSRTCTDVTHNDYLAVWTDPTDFIEAHSGPADEIIVTSNATSKIYFLKNNILHHITDYSIYEDLRDYKYGPVQTWRDSDLESFFYGSKILSDGLICQEQNSPDIYLIQYGEKRSFTNESVYTNRGYILSGGDPISPTVLWLPSGMLSNYPVGNSITDAGRIVNGELYFSKNGVRETVFKENDIIESRINLTAGDGYTVYNYVRLTWPDGIVKYCYYADGQSGGNYLFSDEKQPLTTVEEIGRTFNIVPDNWNTNWQFNSYQVTSSNAQGQYKVEYWYEDINKPGTVLFRDTKFYTIQSETSIITRSPSSLSNSCIQGSNASSQSFEVWNAGSGTLSYTISDNVGWLSCSPASATSSGEHDNVNVNYSTTGLAAGTYNATITISASGASNSPQTVGVTLTVAQPTNSLEHFTSVVNPTGKTQPIVVHDITLDGVQLSPDDEIGIYDGSLLVGAGKVGNLPMIDPIVVYIEFESPDGSTLQGGKTGNPMIFRAWVKNNNSEHPADVSSILNGSPYFSEGSMVAVDLEIQTLRSQNIQIEANKLNLISFAVQPQNPDAESIFYPVPNFVIAQDDNGNVCIPPDIVYQGHPGSNTIQNIDIRKGYSVFIAGAASQILQVAGLPINLSQTLINLKSGKLNKIAFPSLDPQNVADIFNETNNEQVFNSLVIIQNDEGKIFTPPDIVYQGHPGTNTIQQFIPGDGYSLFHRSNSDLNFTYTSVPSVTKRIQSDSKSDDNQSDVIVTGKPHAVFLINENVQFEKEDTIAIYVGDLCVGLLEYKDSLVDPLIIWQHLPEFDLPGTKNGDEMSIRILKSNGKSIQDLRAKGDIVFDNKRLFSTITISKSSISQRDMDEEKMQIPDKTMLLQNYPNPFNPSTTIPFSIDSPKQVTVTIYNIRGETVKVLINGYLQPAVYNVQWHGDFDNGSHAPAGIYLCKLVAGTNQFVHKMLYTK